jgi:UDP-N-acetylglucosamine diphosphorylase/glucosamine-1-phosphate N-acetyltransferase
MDQASAPQPNAATEAPPDAVILAAGKGKRMGSDRAKVLFEVAARPMVHWVVKACRDAGVRRCIVVIGHGGDEVKSALAGVPGPVPGVAFVEQAEQLGTGHATRMAAPLFEGRPPTDVFVLAGDGPLIRPATLRKLLDTHRSRHAAATLATAVIDDPSGYGRVLRDADGSFRAIVEEKDATADQKRVHEINPSYYCFRSDELFAALSRVRNDNSQGEYYVTDVPGLLKAEGKTVVVVDAVPADDVLSINTPEQLAEVDRILRERLARRDAEPARGRAPAGARGTQA